MLSRKRGKTSRGFFSLRGAELRGTKRPGMFLSPGLSQEPLVTSLWGSHSCSSCLSVHLSIRGSVLSSPLTPAQGPIPCWILGACSAPRVMSKAQVFPELLTLPQQQHHPPHPHTTSGSRGRIKRSMVWALPQGICPVFGAEALELFSHSLLQPKVNIL